MSTYPSLAAYTVDVKAARAAYAFDMAVQEGLCPTCKTRKRDEDRSTCWTCRHEQRSA